MKLAKLSVEVPVMKMMEDMMSKEVEGVVIYYQTISDNFSTWIIFSASFFLVLSVFSPDIWLPVKGRHELLIVNIFSETVIGWSVRLSV